MQLFLHIYSSLERLLTWTEGVIGKPIQMGKPNKSRQNPETILSLSSLLNHLCSQSFQRTLLARCAVDLYTF